MQYTSLCGDQHLLRQSLGGYFTQGNPPPLKIFSHICPLSMCVCMYVWVGVFHRIICENIADSKTLKYFLSYLLRTRIFLQRTTRPSSHLRNRISTQCYLLQSPFSDFLNCPSECPLCFFLIQDLLIAVRGYVSLDCCNLRESACLLCFYDIDIFKSSGQMSYRMSLSGDLSDWLFMIRFWLNILARRRLGWWVSSVHVRSHGMSVCWHSWWCWISSLG